MGVKEDILNLIRDEFVERYRRKDALLREADSNRLPGDWFGLEEVSRIVDGHDLFAMTTTYLMNDNLCGVLELQSGTLLRLSEVGGQITDIQISNFEKAPADLVRIKQQLENSISWFLLGA